MAPHVVAQAIKTAVLASRVFEKLGFPVNPAYDEPRNDIIQAIRFEDADKLIACIQAIQMASPGGQRSPARALGHAGLSGSGDHGRGTFVAGASIELSADAPIRPPYVAYLQGGLTYAHGRTGWNVRWSICWKRD